MPSLPPDVIAWLVRHARDTEWQKRHAAENRYCPYCASERDDWQDQDQHHPGCEYVAMMRRAEGGNDAAAGS